ncbi:hypothetical protein EUTSA_v10015091mg [Eutrema salsugineum]|uniref:Uncharacterized protein n=1 Tax=Eutrema salsugineum TaxID=72664 RepID=V4LUT1_EUTSA|nr:hypothetical protein EUTSA_v10015091mg [Eutrema salsugineum]
MEKINQAGSWVSATVISAFFNSLEHCSCVNLSTFHDDEDEDGEESFHRPFALSAAPHPNVIVKLRFDLHLTGFQICYFCPMVLNFQSLRCSSPAWPSTFGVFTC